MPGKVPDTVWIFRIVHFQNLRFLLEHGMFAASHEGRDKRYVFIGDKILTEQRGTYPIRIRGAGSMGDYVPFYFGQRSPMLYNIHTGWRGIPKQPQREIVYICCTLDSIEQAGCRYIFTDGHAKQAISQFYEDRAQLDQVDWNVVYKEYWRNDDEDADRQRRKQAECLVRHHVPVSCILRIVAYDEEMQKYVQGILDDLQLNIDIRINPKGKFYY
jgi:hypothetical protein